MSNENEWYRRCASCEAWTSPIERERRSCRACGGDPRSAATRRADVAWMVAVTVGLVLAAPAIIVIAAGLDVHEWLSDRGRS